MRYYRKNVSESKYTWVHIQTDDSENRFSVAFNQNYVVSWNAVKGFALTKDLTENVRGSVRTTCKI